MSLFHPEPVLPPTQDLLIPDAIAFNIKHNPNQPFFIFADAHAPNGVQVITHLEFGRAAHRLAHALRPNRSGKDGETVAIICLSDSVFYQALVAGCIIAGLVPFPISPRNSPAAVVNLLEKASCQRIIATRITLKSLIDGISSHIVNSQLADVLQVEEVPAFATAYPNLGCESLIEHPFVPYPDRTQPLQRDDICIYLHSSGSTGFPKAIPQTHQAWINWALLPGVSDFRTRRARIVAGSMALPPFHTLGLYMQFHNPIYGLVPISVYPPTATAPELVPITPSPQNILEHLKLTKANVLIIIPSLLHLWSAIPDAVSFLATLQFVGYSGGSLAPKLGNFLVDSGVRLHSVYGGTEFGSPAFSFTREGEDKDWDYAWEKHCPMVLNLHDVDGYATSDLWARHPSKEGLWKIVGRLDDVIVHASGEKTVPAPMEDIIMSSPLHGVVMFGRERDQTGVLVEPKPGYNVDSRELENLAALRNKIWPVVEEANKVAPAFSRIFKEMILFTSDQKPLPRAGKGTVMRKAALALYEQEIVALYDNVESNIKAAEDVAPPATWNLDDVQAWLVLQAVDLLSGNKVSDSVDLFEQGFDSLSATFLRLRIIGALRASKEESVERAAQALSQNLIYSYPVLRDLAAHLVSLFSAGQDHQCSRSASARIEAMIEKYSKDLDDSPGIVGSSWSEPAVVLLTGSTGNLGSEILAALLGNNRVQRVYAFNRPPPAPLTIEQRQLDRFQERGLNPELLKSDKLFYLLGDAAQPDFGLDHDQLNLLSQTVNTVIHNAWKLNFNLSLSAFEPNIQGTRHLIDLVRRGTKASEARFLFTSSISSAQSWPTTNGSYPEEIVNDPSFAVGGGYGEGKYVAERILAKSGLQSMSLRIGQISGGSNGAWATTDWVPILVKSSITIGSLPDIEGVISWIPMDVVAAAIAESALNDAILPAAVNLVHPRPVQGSTIIAAIQTAIADVLGKRLEIVPFRSWLSIIEVHAENATKATMMNIPAVKLLDFFRSISGGNDALVSSLDRNLEAGGLPTFSTEKMLLASPKVLRELRYIGTEDAKLWVKYWQEVGYLN
ncbi:putative NRPS-like protein biosynthetic cluster [Arthromyces matolae]|nr:putative NRPS-like protein biosynthetic cluster [Arthromyces matolae]